MPEIPDSPSSAPVPVGEREALIGALIAGFHDKQVATLVESEGGPLAGMLREYQADRIFAAGFSRSPAVQVQPLTVRENPAMPGDDQLHLLFGGSGGDDWAAKGLRAVWRAGCDAGMVAK